MPSVVALIPFVTKVAAAHVGLSLLLTSLPTTDAFQMLIHSAYNTPNNILYPAIVAT